MGKRDNKKKLNGYEPDKCVAPQSVVKSVRVPRVNILFPVIASTWEGSKLGPFAPLGYVYLEC